MGNFDKITRLQQRKQQLEELSKSENGKKSARSKINLLFDDGSFIELGAFVSEKAATEGVITGYGTVDGRLVYAYAQDFSVFSGAIGSVAAKKISDIINMAAKTGAPVISILDSNGVRIEEGINVLSGIGANLAKCAEISGVVPQIALITGSCAGGAVFYAGLSDFVFVLEGNSSVFMTGPDITAGVTGEQTDAESLGGAAVCAENGIAQFSYKKEEDCILAIKKLLNFLPSNNLEISPVSMSTDDVNRLSENIASIIPDDSSAFDITSLIKEITDDNELLEVSPEYANNIVTCFSKLGGMSVGIIANQSNSNDGVLDIESAKKAARFIRICNSFNIPIITFVDVPGFKAGQAQEHGGISIYGASVVYAYAEATVPKISVVVRRAYGSAYLAMGAKAVGADLVIAYPTAQISIMAPEGAAGILYNDEIAKADDPIAKRTEKINEYAETTASAYTAAQNGFVDDIIDPAETRPRLISALDVLASKRDERMPKKHGNMPV
jgi:acetyl-CoA carboxylase carboxyltransferase component